MNQTHTVTFEHIRGGQARPYADSVYEFIMSFSAERNDNGWVDVWTPPEKVVKEYARLQRKFVDNPDWHDTKLEELKEIEPGKWHVKIVQPYSD